LTFGEGKPWQDKYNSEFIKLIRSIIKHKIFQFTPEHSETIPKHSETIPEHSETIPEHSETILEHSEIIPKR
jgi:hypothetical protein